MEKLDLTTRNLRKFGLTMTAVLFVINIFVLLRHKHGASTILFVSVLFFFFAVVRPVTLKPIYTSWMKMAFILSWINTRLILIIIFYLIFSPLGLIIKLCGKDLLERKIDRSRDSYWKPKEKRTFDKSGYERQF